LCIYVTHTPPRRRRRYIISVWEIQFVLKSVESPSIKKQFRGPGGKSLVGPRQQELLVIIETSFDRYASLARHEIIAARELRYNTVTVIAAGIGAPRPRPCTSRKTRADTVHNNNIIRV